MVQGAEARLEAAEAQVEQLLESCLGGEEGDGEEAALQDDYQDTDDEPPASGGALSP